MRATIDERRFLEGVEEQIRGALGLQEPEPGAEPDLLLSAARHLCIAGGKRARPRLTLYFGQAARAPERALADVAVAAEFIHAASLLHDDVVDEGTQRRGRPTVNARWGNTVAVLGGDLVLTLAFDQIKPYSKSIIAEAIELVAQMTRAAIAEVQARGRLELGLRAWEQIARGKTGELFAWCGRAAAHLAGDAEALERFGRCGRHLGVAFQLGDDLVDLMEGTSGKDRYSDIRTRSLSYPLLTAVASSTPVRENLLRAWRKPQLSAEEVCELGEAVLKTGALERTWEQMEAEVAAAIEALGPYRHRAGGADIAEWAARLCNGVLHGGGGKGT
jgi:octaprenyl-diphosphate synthase